MCPEEIDTYIDELNRIADQRKKSKNKQRRQQRRQRARRGR